MDITAVSSTQNLPIVQNNKLTTQKKVMIAALAVLLAGGIATGGLAFAFGAVVILAAALATVATAAALFATALLLPKKDEKKLNLEVKILCEQVKLLQKQNKTLEKGLSEAQFSRVAPMLPSAQEQQRSEAVHQRAFETDLEAMWRSKMLEGKKLPAKQRTDLGPPPRMNPIVFRVQA
ncbi:MAG: hypothetical protein MRY21_04585 [Simkaniaceae bacterium]|nr:hypothetical protein [Simkaniaceae bacterium]